MSDGRALHIYVDTSGGSGGNTRLDSSVVHGIMFTLNNRVILMEAVRSPFDVDVSTDFEFIGIIAAASRYNELCKRASPDMWDGRVVIHNDNDGAVHAIKSQRYRDKWSTIISPLDEMKSNAKLTIKQRMRSSHEMRLVDKLARWCCRIVDSNNTQHNRQVCLAEILKRARLQVDPRVITSVLEQIDNLHVQLRNELAEKVLTKKYPWRHLDVISSDVAYEQMVEARLTGRL